MTDPVSQLVALVKRIEPTDGYFDGYSLIDVLEADAAAMADFRAILSASAAEQLDHLCDQPVYGFIVAEAADALDLLPTDPRNFKTAEQLRSIPADKVLGELCSACILNDTNAVEFFSARTDVNTLDHNKQSPLCYAVGNNHIECVKILLRRRANPNLVQNWGNTAMHICAMSKASKAIFQLLVESGGDLTVRNDDGKTPVEVMGQERRTERLC